MSNTFWSSQSFQLVSMLVCVAFVACFFIHKYAHGKDINEKDQKIQKIHSFYVVGILVFIIIELVTGLCMGGNNSSTILSFVGFAATLSSLIMSIVAIIFTIVTSNRGEEQYRKIDSASDKVTDSLNKFSDKTVDIDKSVGTFRDISKDLSFKMDTLLREMGSMHSEVSDLKKQLEPQELLAPIPSNSEDQDAQRDAIGLLLSRFVSVGSFSGNLALLACVLAKESGKTSFSIQQITTQDNVQYTFGYLVAAVAAGLIDGQVTPDNCNITGCFEGLKKLLDEAIDAFINKQTDEKTKNSYIQSRMRIEDLFKK